MHNRIWKLTIITLLLWLQLSCRGAESGNTAVSEVNSETVSNALSGSLVFIEQTNRDQILSWHDLETGETKALFKAPANGWIAQAIAAPNGQQIVMAYAPPPPEGQIQFGYTNLYTVSSDEASEPEPLIKRDNPEEILFNPVWSPDGRYIYYSHIIPDGENPEEFTFLLERLEVASGTVEATVENGVWPRLSPNGQQIAFAILDTETQTRDLYLANADGTDAALIVSSADFVDLDAPLFSPDGSWLYFSAVTQEPSTTSSWWDKLLGVQIVSAHSVPSDWWRLPLAGGEPERLTTINEIGMYGVFSPDGRVFAFSSATGIYTMNPDGTELSKLLEIPAADSLTWVP